MAISKSDLRLALAENPELLAEAKKIVENPEVLEGLKKPLGKVSHGGLIGSAHPIALEDLIRPVRE